jgi:hypothetical protein
MRFWPFARHFLPTSGVSKRRERKSYLLKRPLISVRQSFNAFIERLCLVRKIFDLVFRKRI